jgi:hypothetical protein
MMMQVNIGKGLTMTVDETRFNPEVMNHIVSIGLRNLLGDAHANATAKADPTGYVAKSRELAERKLQSLYDGIVRAQSTGGIAKPTDPVAQVILRLARKAVQKDPAKELAALPKTVRLAALNKRAMEYATAHDAALRPRAVKIVELESDEPTHDFPAKPVAKATIKKKAA